MNSNVFIYTNFDSTENSSKESTCTYVLNEGSKTNLVDGSKVIGGDVDTSLCISNINLGDGDKIPDDWNVHKVIADDESFFINIERQIRDKFSRWEVEECLPLVKMVYARSEIYDSDMIDYPVEGYYYKSKELTELFKRIRNIQQNKDVYKRIRIDDQVKFLKGVYENEIFGLPAQKSYPWPDSPIHRRWDLLTNIMSDDGLFYTYAHRPWSIDGVMNVLSGKLVGNPTLVELAGLIGKPLLLTAAAETNSLGRMYAAMSGSFSMGVPKSVYIWNVSEIVFDLGKKIVEAYNKLMKNRNTYLGNKGDTEIILPTADNMKYLDWGSMELPRVAHLGYLTETKYNYFWLADYDGKVYDYYTRDFITTNDFVKNHDEILTKIKNSTYE